jgi:hypothetical protein
MGVKKVVGVAEAFKVIRRNPVITSRQAFSTASPSRSRLPRTHAEQAGQGLTIE